ncbi:unnamed protein product, partial [Mesorhabditis spiculigera]
MSSMLHYSKSFKTIGKRTGDLYTRARSKFARSFRGNRHSDPLQGTEQWTVASDYQDPTEGHLTVARGDRVELIESPGGATDLVLVAMADDREKQGLVPFSILLPGS